MFTAANKCIKALVKDEAENEDIEGNIGTDGKPV